MTLEMLCLLEPAIADGTLSQDHDDSRDDARKGQQRDRARSIVQLPAIHLGGGHWRRRGKQSSERGRDVFRPWGGQRKASAWLSSCPGDRNGRNGRKSSPTTREKGRQSRPDRPAKCARPKLFCIRAYRGDRPSSLSLVPAQRTIIANASGF